VAAGGVAAGKKLAAERGAWICFQDEAGHTLRPAQGADLGATRTHTGNPGVG
jgi:hypothetical protein